MHDRGNPIEQRRAGRRILRLRGQHSRDEADEHQHEDQHAEGHVHEQNLDLLRRRVGHRCQHKKSDEQHGNDNDGEEPMQDHQQGVISRHLHTHP